MDIDRHDQLFAEARAKRESLASDRYFDGQTFRFARPQPPEVFPVEFTQRVFVKPNFCGPDKPLAEAIEFMQRRISERIREQFEEFSRALFLGSNSEVDELCAAVDAWLSDLESENAR